MRSGQSFGARRLLTVCCCLAVLLVACGSPSPSGTSSGQTPEPSGSGTKVPTVTTSTRTTVTPTATSTVATQASCPPAGTARAAIMPSLEVGKHANIVYTFQSYTPYQYQGSTYQDVTSYLKRYDITTGAKAVIASLPHSSIASATISPDGQWIMFETYIAVHPLAGNEFNTVLQLVRIDGQYLQTLYCGTGSPLALRFPTGYVGATSWSPNQKLVLFNQFSLVQSRPTGMVYLLDLTSGNLQPEVEAGLSPSTWLDTTRAYLIVQGDGISPARPGLVILDTSKGPHQQETSLQTLLNTGPCQSYAINVATTQLFVSHCTFNNNYTVSGPSTISVEPGTGGTPQTIFTSQQLAVCSIEMISSTTLLFLVCNTPNTSQNGWWEIHSDGSGLTRLQASSSYTMFAFGYPLPIMASDGNMYALWVQIDTSNELVVGTLNGGTPKTFASIPSTDGTVAVVGWTTT